MHMWDPVYNDVLSIKSLLSYCVSSMQDQFAALHENPDLYVSLVHFLTFSAAKSSTFFCNLTFH